MDVRPGRARVEALAFALLAAAPILPYLERLREKPITRFSIAQSDAVTAVSHFLVAETARIFGYTETEVIPNFINAEEYQRRENQALRRELAPQDEKLILHVSNFRPVKRISDCVHAFARIVTHVKARLVMCGDGPTRAEAERLAASYGLTDAVSFVVAPLFRMAVWLVRRPPARPPRRRL